MMPPLKIATAQINPIVGDINANAEMVIAAVHEAKMAGADVVLTPELAVSGYPPEDLLLRQDFLGACDEAIASLADALYGKNRREKNPALILGHPALHEGRRYNAATFLSSEHNPCRYYKQCLPNEAVFDENRYFSPGNAPCVIEIKGVKAGLAICEDLWFPEVARQAKQAGAQILLTLNASPCHLGKQAQRVAILACRVKETGLPIIYGNLVGGQDELIFDGASFALNQQGEIVASLPQFETGLMLVNYQGGDILPGKIAPMLSREAKAWQALILGVRDYVGKNRFPGVLIGLSGGIDSALTACIAADALGAEKVRCVMMPSPYTAPMSLEDSRKLAQNLGIQYEEIPIESAMQTFEGLLAAPFAGTTPGIAEENIQARIRGLILMALSNKSGALVLTTGNKSEMALGYCTLYGDMAGGFAVLKDVSKTLVYRLAAYRNQSHPDTPPIPQNIIDRPPSAELRPDQKDQDSLPPYDILDAITESYMEENRSIGEIIKAGFLKEDVLKVTRLLRLAEYKRRQSPPGIRITSRSFGKDWRYPITNRYTGS